MRRLGPYTLVRELGRGGMGVVHEAVDPDGRRVALKLILEAELGSAEERLRFQREARAARLVEHPALVRLLDAGHAEGTPYLALELVEGETLQERVRREGPLPDAEVVRIGRELAGALGALHGVGLLHRDVKPGNVLLGADGAVKLLDLGLVKDRAPAAERLTLSGQVLGTPGYLAPEQALGERGLDERVDVYGLGATLYYALCAAPPHSGGSTLALLAAALEEPVVPPSRLAPGIAPALEAVALRCLEKEPGARFADMPALEDALAASLVPAGGPACVLPALLVAVALTVLGLAGVLSLLLSGPGPAPAVTPPSAVTPSAAPSATPAPSASVSPTTTPPETPPTPEARDELEEVIAARERKEDRASCLARTAPLLERHPSWARLRYLRAVLLLELQRFAAAGDELRAGDAAPGREAEVALRRSVGHSFLTIGVRLAEERRHADAHGLLSGLSLDELSQDPTVGILYVGACRAVDRHRDGLPVLRVMRARGFTQWQIAYNLAGSLLSEGQHDEAYALYEEVVQSADAPPHYKGIALLRTAENRIGRGQLDQGEAALERAARFAPDLPELRAQRATLLLERGDHAQAEALARGGLAGEHGWRCARVIAAALARQGRRAEAEAFAAEALQRDPDDARLKRVLEEALAR